jgi:hypothetical protein
MSCGTTPAPLPAPRLTEPERAWLLGWSIATLSIRRMSERDVASWFRHLMRLPVKDAEVRGMIEALAESGVDWSLGAEDEVATLTPPQSVAPPQ